MMIFDTPGPKNGFAINVYSGTIHKKFSNSLIIHQVKTKEITTVKEVWIPGLN